MALVKQINLIPNGKYYIQYGIEYNTREAIILYIKSCEGLKLRTKEEILESRNSAYKYLIS